MSDETKKNPLPIPTPVSIEYFKRCCDKWIEATYIKAFGFARENFEVAYFSGEVLSHCVVSLTQEYCDLIDFRGPDTGRVLARIETGPLGFQLVSCYAPPAWR